MTWYYNPLLIKIARLKRNYVSYYGYDPDIKFFLPGLNRSSLEITINEKTDYSYFRFELIWNDNGEQMLYISHENLNNNYHKISFDFFNLEIIFTDKKNLYKIHTLHADES